MDTYTEYKMKIPPAACEHPWTALPQSAFHVLDAQDTRDDRVVVESGPSQSRHPIKNRRGGVSDSDEIFPTATHQRIPDTLPLVTRYITLPRGAAPKTGGQQTGSSSSSTDD